MAATALLLAIGPALLGGVLASSEEIDHISIEDAPNGAGVTVDTIQMRVGESRTLYAVGRDTAGGYVANVPVAWIVRGAFGTADPAYGASTRLTALRLSIGSVTAVDEAGRTSESTVAVISDNVDHIAVRTAGDGTGVGYAHIMLPGDQATFYAVGLDENDLYAGPVIANWEARRGGDGVPLGSLSSARGFFTVLTAERTGRGVIQAEDDAQNGADNLITVWPGPLDHFAFSTLASTSPNVCDPAFAALPSTVSAGTGLPLLTVAACDAYNNIQANYTGRVAFVSTDPYATLPSDAPFTPLDGGAKSFPSSAFVLRTIGAQSITATDTDALHEGHMQVVVSGTASMPGAPQNLNALAGPGNVILRWDAPTTNGGAVVTGYSVYRGTVAGSEILLARVGDVRSFVDENVPVGTYYYQVTASNAAGESARSTEASATVLVGPAPPCASCSTRGLDHQDNLTVAPAVLLPPEDVSGQSTPDYPGSSPVPTPPVGQDIVDIIVCNAGAPTGCAAPGSAFLCVDVLLPAPSGPTTVPIACVNRGNLGPVDPLIPRGATQLLVIDLVDVPGTPAQEVPDVPPTAAGSVGATPKITVTVDASYAYDSSHLAPGASVLGHTVYQPFLADTGDTTWFLSDGAGASLTVSMTAYQDGVELRSVQASIPWLGQALAAAQATLGSAP